MRVCRELCWQDMKTKGRKRKNDHHNHPTSLLNLVPENQNKKTKLEKCVLLASLSSVVFPDASRGSGWMVGGAQEEEE